jgi:hypothetical protein
MIAVATAGSRVLAGTMDVAPISATLEATDPSAPTMDEQSFRVFYERTSRAPGLPRAPRRRVAAEDLLQEACG